MLFWHPFLRDLVVYLAFESWKFPRWRRRGEGMQIEFKLIPNLIGFLRENLWFSKNWKDSSELCSFTSLTLVMNSRETFLFASECNCQDCIAREVPRKAFPLPSDLQNEEALESLLWDGKRTRNKKPRLIWITLRVWESLKQTKEKNLRHQLS